MRRLAALVLPEGPVLAAAALLWTWETPRTGLAGFLQMFPAVVLVAGSLLAWRFGRPRALLTFVLLALTERVLHHADPGGTVHIAVALFLPLDVLLLTLLPLYRIRSVATAIVATVLVFEAVLVLVLRDPAFAATAALLDAAVLPSVLTRWTPLPAPALLAFVGAAGVVGARTVLHPNAQGRGVLWVLVAAFLALHAGPAAPAAGIPGFTYWLAIAGLMLVVAMVETSHALAFRDGLTGLPGRRAFDEALARLGGPWAVAMVDIDRFKAVNDTFGHDVGDQVLRMVATGLQHVGGGGQPYRYGGEEFAILFRERSGDEVAPHLEALRAAIAATPFVRRAPDRPARKPDTPRRRSRRGRALDVTVSIGYAASGIGARPDPGAIVTLADEALYRAKQRGRNRVEGPEEAAHGRGRGRMKR